MLERKHKGILSWKLKKLANHVDDLKIILISMFSNIGRHTKIW